MCSVQCAQCGKAGIQIVLQERGRARGGEGAGQQVGVHEVAANAYGLRQLKAQVEKVVQVEVECVCVRLCVCV